MFRSLGARLHLVIAASFIVMILAFLFVAQSSLKDQAYRQLIDKARSITSIAENARNYIGTLRGQYDAFNDEALFAELERIKDLPFEQKMQELRSMGVYYTIPIVAGMQVAEQAAEQGNYHFRTPKFQARNPENEPTAFEGQMIKQIKAQKLDELWKVDEANNTLNYMMPVVMQQDCMVCHGVRADDPDGDGYDPLGFKMEGWAAGEIHGAYEVIADLGPMQSAIISAMLKTIGTALVLLAIIAAFLTWFLHRQVTMRINQVVDVLDAAAGKDFTQRVHLDGSPPREISHLVQSMNQTFDNISESFEVIGLAAEEVSSASTELSATTSNMSEGADELSDAVSQIASAAEQMSSTVHEISSLITKSAEDASNANHTATDGQRIVANTADEISSVKQASVELTEMVNGLNDSASEIGKIIQVINEIADQTNLLALNAAIEAARAGEHGRGFAVVADEVRKLAEKTQDATKEVASKIRAIQDGAARTQETMEMTQGRVDRGSELAGEAAESLRSIAAVINELNDQFQQVATASEEQSATTTEIAHSIENVKNVADQSAHSVKESASAIEHLNQQALDVSGQLSEFKYQRAAHQPGLPSGKREETSPRGIASRNQDR